jgi:P27 family predicted phage terminase small subunit
MSIANLPRTHIKAKLKPPRHLKKPTKLWWCQVVSDFELEEHHVRILTLACEAWDRGVQARELLQKHGLTYIDQFEQPRPRPEVVIEKDCRTQFARLVRELALSEEGPESPRPPRLRYGGPK